jgi:hypothetical protein
MKKQVRAAIADSGHGLYLAGNILSGFPLTCEAVVTRSLMLESHDIDVDSPWFAECVISE